MPAAFGQGGGEGRVAVRGEHPPPVPERSAARRDPVDGRAGVTGEQRVVVDQVVLTAQVPQQPGLPDELGIDPARVQRMGGEEERGCGHGRQGTARGSPSSRQNPDATGPDRP